MDQFAQSRGDDDLFDDEIVPIAKSSQDHKVSEPQLIDKTATTTIHQNTSLGHEDSEITRTTSRERGRGRGRGRAGLPSRDAPKAGLNESRYAPKSGPPQMSSRKATTVKEEVNVKPDITNDIPASEFEQTVEPAPEHSAPTGPSNPTAARPPAVKGDRLNTGGVQRPKLTEDELNVKLAAAKERNQNRAAAYAREQADAENFAERERMATVKRAQENADRKALEGEREKNRERKLRGQGGREWDAKKNESDYAGRGRGDRRRHFSPGNDDDDDLSMYEWNEDRGRGRGRGRGGRGGRGRGRGDGSSHRGIQQTSQPKIGAESDFPALPSSKVKTESKGSEAVKSVEQAESPAIGSWADQVEAGEAGRA